jgi:hypothetical protein
MSRAARHLNARLLGIGALLLRVQETLTDADRAWLEGLQHRLPRHPRAQRCQWARAAAAPPCCCHWHLPSSLHSWTCAHGAWTPSLQPRTRWSTTGGPLRSTPPCCGGAAPRSWRTLWPLATPPSQLMVEVFGALRMPVMAQSDSISPKLHRCADPGGGGAAAHRGRPAAAGAADDRLRRNDSCRHCRHRRGGGCCGVCRRGGGGCCGVCRRRGCSERWLWGCWERRTGAARLPGEAAACPPTTEHGA